MVNERKEMFLQNGTFFNKWKKNNSFSKNKRLLNDNVRFNIFFQQLKTDLTKHVQGPRHRRTDLKKRPGP